MTMIATTAVRGLKLSLTPMAQVFALQLYSGVENSGRLSAMPARVRRSSAMVAARIRLSLFRYSAETLDSPTPPDRSSNRITLQPRPSQEYECI